MGKQSSRMIYRGKDHKDIYYQDNYHDAMYKGSQLVWRKLYDRYCSFNANKVIELDAQEIIVGDENIYTYTAIQHNDNYSIATFRVKETKECFTALSSDLLKWKRIKELDGVIDNNHYLTTVYTANFNGFWVYQLHHGFVYYIEIDDYNNSCTVTAVEIPDIILMPYQSGGISNNFYAITAQKTFKYTLYIAKRNGEFISKQLGYPFDNVNTAPNISKIFANIDDHIYIVSDYETTYTTRTYLFHISGFDTDFITTAFDSYRSSYFHRTYIGIDIIYSSTSQILLLFHNGLENKGVSLVHREWYDNMEFYKIGPSGNLEFVLRREENKDMSIPLFGSEKYNSLILKFSHENDDGITEYGKMSLFYESLSIGSASHYGNKDSLEIIDGLRNFECVIGRVSTEEGELIVYIDNLFFEESEGNFAFIMKE